MATQQGSGNGDEGSMVGANLAQIMASLGANASGGEAALFPPRPVEAWDPTICGDAGIEIRRDGSWWHQGGRMTRERLVRLFASILRKDVDGQTWLVTPAEKVVVSVEDAPFVVVRVDRIDDAGVQRIVFTTNLGDSVAAGPDHPMRASFADQTAEPAVYVMVRGRLEARLLRAPWYELADWVERGPDGRHGVMSGGIFFPLEAAACGGSGGATAAA
jgi:uncharacterized protein